MDCEKDTCMQWSKFGRRYISWEIRVEKRARQVCSQKSPLAPLLIGFTFEEKNIEKFVFFSTLLVSIYTWKTYFYKTNWKILGRSVLAWTTVPPTPSNLVYSGLKLKKSSVILIKSAHLVMSKEKCKIGRD